VKRGGASPRSAAEGIGVPGQVGLDAVLVEVVEPVGLIVGVGGDRRRGEGLGVDGAVAHRVVAIFELLAAGVVGAGQAIEVVMLICY
jgi:hypothetical protein